MYKAVILPLAKEDILEAALWYNTKQKNLGKRFTKQLRVKILLIQQHPQLAPIRYDNVRTAVLNVFPYMIHYTVDDKKKEILIAAVFHTSLNPERWKKKELNLRNLFR